MSATSGRKVQGIVLFFVIGILLLAPNLHAQHPFLKRLVENTAEGQLFGEPLDMDTSPDSSVLLLTDISTNGKYKMGIIKYGVEGKVRWSNILDFGKRVESTNLAVTAEGSSLFVGNPSHVRDSSLIVIRIDRTGLASYFQAIKLPGHPESTTGIELSDGSIAVCGSLYDSCLFVGKLNGNLQIEWFSLLQGENNCYARQPQLIEGRSHSLVIFFEYLDIKRKSTLSQIILDGSGNSFTQKSFILNKSGFEISSSLHHSSGAIFLYGRTLVSTELSTSLLKFVNDTTISFAKRQSILDQSTPFCLSESADHRLISTATSGTNGLWTTTVFKFDTNGSILTISNFDQSSYNTGSVHPQAAISNHGGVYCLVGQNHSIYMASLDSGLNGCHTYNTLSVMQDIPIEVTFRRFMTIHPLSLSYSNLPISVSDTMVTSGEEYCEQLDAPLLPTKESPLLIVSPNPVQHPTPLTVALTALLDKAYTLVIQDLNGRMVQTTTLTPGMGNMVSIPTSRLSSGVYSIELIETATTQTIFSTKFIVQ